MVVPARPDVRLGRKLQESARHHDDKIFMSFIS